MPRPVNRAGRPAKIVFLDRDGVINVFPGVGAYVTRPSQFRFLPRVLKALRRLKRAGAEVHVVTNQGCIARGLITRAALERMHERMRRRVERAGGRLDGIHYCPHRMDDRCRCKKPAILLFRRALAGRAVLRSRVAFVGDSREDMEAGRRLGCTRILVLSGRTRESDLAQFRPKPHAVKKDLWEATAYLLRKKY